VTGEDRDSVMGHSIVNSGAEEYSKLGPMKPETIRILDKFYEPFVRKMAQLLDDDRFLWRDVYNSTANLP
jgi:hypothetical protein